MPELTPVQLGFRTSKCYYLSTVLLDYVGMGAPSYWGSGPLLEALKLFVGECEGQFEWLSAGVAERDVKLAVDRLVIDLKDSGDKVDCVTFRNSLADKLCRLWHSRDAFEDARTELAAQVEAGVLDVGWDSEDERDFRAERSFTPSVSTVVAEAASSADSGPEPPVELEVAPCALSGSCFYLACLKVGVKVNQGVRSVAQMSSADASRMAAAKQYKVHAVHYSKDHPLNHMYLADASATNFKSTVVPRSGCESAAGTHVELVTSMLQFFNPSNEYARIVYYADDDRESGFGADLDQNVVGLSGDDTALAAGGVPKFDGSTRGDPEFVRTSNAFEAGGAKGPGFGGAVSGFGKASAGAKQSYAPPPLSVVDDGVVPGVSNMAGGVVRAKKRVVASRSVGGLAGPVSKSYRTVAGVMFNNADEMYQDKISREYAQEIIEELFSAWGVPMHQPKAAKFAEDLLFLFLITTTASNKADYNREFSIPVESSDFPEGAGSGELEVSFTKFSAILESGHGKTRRQFARAVADDQRLFLRQEENVFLLPQLATRVGCESQLAYLAFDGSTHCTNMTSREVTFTKTLESRNLFERDDVIAQGASDRLMGGMSGGVRSVAPR